LIGWLVCFDWLIGVTVGFGMIDMDGDGQINESDLVTVLQIFQRVMSRLGLLTTDNCHKLAHDMFAKVCFLFFLFLSNQISDF
jgi:hypothetical protein